MKMFTSESDNLQNIQRNRHTIRSSPSDPGTLLRNGYPSPGRPPKTPLGMLLTIVNSRNILMTSLQKAFGNDLCFWKRDLYASPMMCDSKQNYYIPNKPWFLCVCSISLLKTLQEKKLLV